MKTISITDRYYNEKLSIVNALQQVNDPELNINIVDLGLVYEIDINDDQMIRVSLTLSTPSCPLGNLITAHARLAIEQEMPGYTAVIDLVWFPKWSADMASEDARSLLGW